MKNDRVKKILLAVFFVALLSFPVIRTMWLKRKADKISKEKHSQILKRYGFYLQDVAKKVGINFTHHPPKLDPKVNNIMPIIADMGASVAVGDFNQDGYPDIYLTNSAIGTKNALYENLGNGKFKDIASQLGVAALNNQNGTSMGAVWGDYDNDGYPDLFVYKWGKSMLFHNDKGKGFTNVSKDIPLPKWMNANTAIWFDYNNDGRLDLFVGGYYKSNINLWHLKNTKIMPNSFEYAKNGGRNYLFENMGNGKFKDVTKQVGLMGHRWTLAASAADLNHNGYTDLVLANDYGVDEVFINEKGKYFKNIGPTSRIGFAPKSGMNVTFGDALNQGNLDIYISNISQPGILIQGNNLWVPQLGREQNQLTYHNLAEDLGIELGGWSWGAQFGDFNDDGHLDLYVANGYVSGKKKGGNNSYWYDYSKVAVGNHTIINDAKNWPKMNGKSLSGYERNKIWLNNGSGGFEEVGKAVGGKQIYDSRAVALADLWNTGALDIIVANQNGPVMVYKNTVAPGRHWIGFKLIGTKSNRSAIGAEATLFWNHHIQKQVVTGGNGFCSENQRRLFYGLGKNAKIDSLVINWPSGQYQVIRHPSVDQYHKITEPK